MALTVAVALLMRCCEGANLRGFMPEEDEELRSNRLYRDYGLIRNRPIRNDDAFDDYGHLRFGRSYD
ncbi:hypothetical protein O3G_MSEX009400 [Manduca sexta]|nr:hypothetical protein O3G_MSEX009400 [Manduca sexta]